MTYKCDCGHVEEWSEKDFADKGEPVCPECDDDMKPMTDEEFKEYCNKEDERSWSDEMRREAIDDFGSNIGVNRLAAVDEKYLDGDILREKDTKGKGGYYDLACFVVDVISADVMEDEIAGYGTSDLKRILANRICNVLCEVMIDGVGKDCETLSPLKGKTFTVIVGGEEEDEDLNFDELVDVLSSYSDFFRFTKEEQEKEVAYWIEEGEIYIDPDQKAKIK